MKYILKNLRIYSDDGWTEGDIAVDNGRIVSVGGVFPSNHSYDTINCYGLTALPGFADVHVHLREPGFCYKEDISSGTAAAARGGYTAVCAMPNLNPVPDSPENLAAEESAIASSAVIGVYPYGAITCGEKGQKLAAMEEMAARVCGFSDDGKGVQSEAMMRSAMECCAKLNKVLAAHCEDESLLHGGCIHKGHYSEEHGLKGICSESEWGPIARDLTLAEGTGCAYHVCHVSSKESVALIRKAKERGINVTCETAPHYLVFCDDELEDDGRFRMNPPIRSRDDRKALLKGLSDGTVDMIATDHAPHSQEEKSRGLAGSLNGIVGLETAFPVLYTRLVLTGILTLEKLVDLMSTTPRRRFSLKSSVIAAGADADFTLFDLEESYSVDPAEFLSRGKSSPFSGMTVRGRCKLTVFGDRFVWREL